MNLHRNFSGVRMRGLSSLSLHRKYVRLHIRQKQGGRNGSMQREVPEYWVGRPVRGLILPGTGRAN
jgi:hypothetical protein